MDDFKYTYNTYMPVLCSYIPYDKIALLINYIKKHQFYTDEIEFKNLTMPFEEVLEDGEEIIQNGNTYQIILKKNVTNDDIETIKYIIDLCDFQLLSDIEIQNNVIKLNLNHANDTIN